MSEKRWRANLLFGTVDEIEIVSETQQYVDVRTVWGNTASIRREAKSTAYTRIYKTEKCALVGLAEYKQEQLESAQAQFEHWQSQLLDVQSKLEKLNETP